MDNDRNCDPAAIYEEIIALLKRQVEKQEIIQTQDETIRMLQEHYKELAAFLDRCCENR